jgi:hypothetical protein
MHCPCSPSNWPMSTAKTEIMLIYSPIFNRCVGLHSFTVYLRHVRITSAFIILCHAPAWETCNMPTYKCRWTHHVEPNAADVLPVQGVDISNKAPLANYAMIKGVGFAATAALRVIQRSRLLYSPTYSHHHYVVWCHFYATHACDRQPDIPQSDRFSAS